MLCQAEISLSKNIPRKNLIKRPFDISRILEDILGEGRVITS